MTSLNKKLVWFFIGLLPLISWSCFIDDVQQTTTVDAGGTFTATVTVTDVNAEHNNAHKGVLAILVPEDWTFC